MSKGKKNRNQDKDTKTIILITAIIQRWRSADLRLRGPGPDAQGRSVTQKGAHNGDRSGHQQCGQA